MRFIPNLLCIFRIFCAPLFILSISNNLKILSIFVLSIGAISDFFDGYIARKFKVESKVGELLDPLADKIFTNAVLWGIFLYNGNHYPILLVAMFMTIRDLLLLLGSIFAILKHIKSELKPIYLSKICTAIVFVLCFLNLILDPNSPILNILGTVSICLIIITSFIYVKRFRDFKIKLI